MTRNPFGLTDEDFRKPRPPRDPIVRPPAALVVNPPPEPKPVRTRAEFKFTIYGIVRRSDRLLLYVGHTFRTLRIRLTAHLKGAVGPRSKGNLWLEWLRANRDVAVDIIELDAGTGVVLEASQAEGRLIAALTHAGVVLLNSTNGAPSRSLKDRRARSWRKISAEPAIGEALLHGAH